MREPMTHSMQLKRMQWWATHGTFPELLSIAGRLCLDADRWRRRALFYERHRDYFPRLASGRFVARCWELDALFRRLSQYAWTLGRQIQWAWTGTEAPLLVAAVRRPALGRRRIIR